MRKSLLALLLFLACLAKAQNIDVLHYKFSLGLSDANDSISGIASIEFRVIGEGHVSFDLKTLDHSGKGMVVQSASATREMATLSVPVEAENDKVILDLPGVKIGDTQTVYILYKGIPDDGLIISKNKFGERTFFGDNWPNRAHHWLPCVDKPDDKATFEFLVTAPAQYSVISNGEKVDEKLLGNGKKLTHWKEDTPLPTKVMVIGAARFATKTYDNSPADLPVSAWVYPQDSTKGFYDFSVAPEIVRFFSDYIAPFPYSKLAHVQSTTIFGGMENASCIFYDEKLIMGKRAEEDVVAHEIAHQWFGDMASEKTFAHLWLSEGFATYFTNLYWEQKYGTKAMQERLEKDRDEVIAFAGQSNHAIVDSTSNLMSLLNVNSYQKGGWVLHMLRNEVGDIAFRKIIQAYYNQYKGGNADTRDFEAVAENVSGKDLKWFFDQWLYRPGIPKLYLSQSVSGGKLILRISQLGDVYRLPLTVLITTKSGKEKRQRIVLTKQDTSVELSLPNRELKDVVLDPGSEILFEQVTSRKRGTREN